MAPAGKISGFRRLGNDWFCDTSLPSDITLVVDGISFHLHKFPLLSRCGRISNIIKQVTSSIDKTFKVLEEFPGGADTFLTIVKFCYNSRIEFTPTNIVILYCAADYLDMTDDYDEENLLPKAESFFHKHVLRHWKDCILALQCCDPTVFPRAEKLHIISQCLNALSVMASTDPTLFGRPMMMYGTMQSPGGSILWNGIHTGAKIHSPESDWWFEDVSNLSVELLERLIRTMEGKGIRPEDLTRAIMYYCKKHLPGLGQWHGRRHGTSRKATIDESVLLRTVVKLLPEMKGKSFCRFLLGLLRMSLILGVSDSCQDSLERKVGIQFEYATLDGLLMPSYSDSDTLYNTDCVERMIHHFVEANVSSCEERVKRVGKLVDDYIAEISSDVNLKPGKIRSLAEALPESCRTLHDGLYHALDIYFKAHPWLLEKERERLCSIIDFQKLSMDACAHASQNERLPLRIIFQVLFFEQMQLRATLAGCLDVTGWGGLVSVARENQVLKVDMERMRSRVRELEQEFSRIEERVKEANR